MNERILCVDSSALILLAEIDSLPLLGPVAIVPAAVHREVLAGRYVHPSLSGIGSLNGFRMVEDVLLPSRIAEWGLGDGESQVLAHAALLSGSEAVIDDRQARQCARALGIAFTGTVGVLIRAKKNGSIPAARPLLEDLLKRGMHLSRELADAALGEVGE